MTDLLKNMSETELRFMKMAHDATEKAVESVESVSIRPNCPAADECSNGVFCKIEHKLIQPRRDPLSLNDFCYGEHRTCPSFVKAETENTDQVEKAKHTIRQMEITRDLDNEIMEEAEYNIGRMK